MKKNKMMRIASVLLIAALLSTSVISGTFAKYVTAGSATDSARVAKWGVTVTTASDLFANSYARDASSPTGTDFANSVSSNVDVVAPGTESTGVMSFGVSGTPEVAVHVGINAVADNDVVLPPGTYTNYTGVGDPTFTLSSEYRPLKYTLKRNGTAVANCENVSLSTIVTYLNGLTSLDYPVDTTDLSDGGKFSSYTLSWKWDFESGNDMADTFLGQVAAGVVDPPEGASIGAGVTITVTVTQID